MSVEVFPLHKANIPIPIPTAVANRPRTPFSFQRFLIPELAGHKGRAIYVDSDMQVFADIKNLWTTPFRGSDLLTVREAEAGNRKPQYSVMLLDCDSLNWRIQDIVAEMDRGKLNYETLMYEMAVAQSPRAAIEAGWNSLESYQPGVTSLVHYTDMGSQPWVSCDNPLGYLWVRSLFSAIDAGAISRDYVKSHVDMGYVRPSLLYQIENRMEDPLLLPRSARALDEAFVPPYKLLPEHGGSKAKRGVHIARALLRVLIDKSGTRRVGAKVKRLMKGQR